MLSEKAQSEVIKDLSLWYLLRWSETQWRRQTYSNDQVLWILAFLLSGSPFYLLWFPTHSLFNITGSLLQCFSKTVSHAELTVLLGRTLEVADEMMEKPFWTFRIKPWPGSVCTETWAFWRLCSNCIVHFSRIGTWVCLLAKCKRRRGKCLT